MERTTPHRRFSNPQTELVAGSSEQNRVRSIRDGCLFKLLMLLSEFKEFKIEKILLRILAKKGRKKAIVALARKVLCILHHLLVNREKYQDSEMSKTKKVKLNWASSPIQMTEQDMINVLVDAGYTVQKMTEGV